MTKQSSSLTQNLTAAQERAALERSTDSPRVNLRSRAQRHRLADAADSTPVTVDTPSPAFDAVKTLYRLYTQDFPGFDPAPYINRYFDGATLYRGVGLDARTQDASEHALMIEIVSSAPDALQNVLNLAGDLRIIGKQISVLVTRQDVTTFEVTEQPLRPVGGGR